MNVLICVLGIILLIVSIFMYIIEKFEFWDADNKFRMVVPVMTIISAILLIFSSSFKIIPTGYTGVRTTFGQVDSVTVQNGFNWKIPFVQNIEIVNNKQQDITVEEEIWSETSQRTAIYYKNIRITYQINPEKSAWIYANVSDYENNLISHNIIASAVKSGSKSIDDTSATNRSIIEPLVLQTLQESLNEKYGDDVVLINKITISDADYEQSYKDAIAAKQKSQLEAEKQAIINQQNIDKANADAEVAVTKAKSDAEAKIIAAEAEAEANNKLEKSITDNILREMYIEKWNGELPKVVSDNSSLMYDLDMNSTDTEAEVSE